MIPIHERFFSWQGEGVHMGRSAFFIRTYGCPVKCPWCDSAGTWHPGYQPTQLQKVEATTLVREAMLCAPSFVVITGGEPTIYDLYPLTRALRDAGLPVHLETSGAFQIKGTFDWITLSPKRNAPPLPLSVALANEYKFIVEAPEDIVHWTKTIFLDRGYSDTELRGRPVWLHPEWSHREDPVALKAITDAVKRNPMYRAGWQLHKLYRADLLDPRSAPAVPLGGNPELGY